MTPVEFLLERIQDEEDGAEYLYSEDDMVLAYVRQECSFKRQVIHFHAKWPVLVEGPREYTQFEDFDIEVVKFAARQSFEFYTQEEYRGKFGSEPPTAPIIREMLKMYTRHPDFKEEWL